MCFKVHEIFRSKRSRIKRKVRNIIAEEYRITPKSTTPESAEVIRTRVNDLLKRANKHSFSYMNNPNDDNAGVSTPSLRQLTLMGFQRATYLIGVTLVPGRFSK